MFSPEAYTCLLFNCSWTLLERKCTSYVTETLNNANRQCYIIVLNKTLTNIITIHAIQFWVAW